MKVLIACEESQVICSAFRARGHDAYSCDLKQCSGGFPEFHIQGDALREAYSEKYDLMIAHPPCTYLSYAGTSHWNDPGRLWARLDALKFFAALWLSPIEKICLENPKGCASPTIAKYDQEIQPHYFGDASLKTTWLWLKNLPMLLHFEQLDLFSDKTHVNKPDPIYVSESGKRLYFSESISGN